MQLSLRITGLVAILLFSCLRTDHAQEYDLLAEIGQGRIQFAAWYPDGEQIFISTARGASIYTRDLKQVASLPSAYMASLSPDGRWIAGLDAGHKLSLWDAQTLEPLDTFKGYDNIERIKTIAWSPDGRFFAAVGYDAAYSLMYVWNVAAHWSLVNATHASTGNLSWSPHGDYLAVYSENGHCMIWAVGVQGGVSTLSIGGNPIVRWQNDTILLTFVQDEYTTVTRWNAATGESLGEARAVGAQSVFSPDGRYGALDRNSSITIEAINGEVDPIDVSLLAYAPDMPWISLMTWDNDSQRVAAGMGSLLRSSPVPIMVIDTEGNILYELSGGLHMIDYLLWSADNQFLLAIDRANQIMIYDMQSGEQVIASQAYTLVGEGLAWSPDGTQLAIGDTINSVTVWDLVTQVPTYTLPRNDSVVSRIQWQTTGEHIALETIDISPNLRNLAPYRHAQVWRVSSDMPERVTPDFRPDARSPLNYARFSADGTHLLISAGLKIAVWKTDGADYRLVHSETLDYGPDDLLLSQSGGHLIYSKDIYGAVYPWRDSEQQQNFRIDLVPYSDRVNTLSRDDELVSIIWDVWDHAYIPEIVPVLARGQAGPEQNPEYFYKDLPGSTEAIVQGYISPRGAYVGAIDAQDNGMIWDGLDGSPVVWIIDAANMVWSPDEARLVVQRTDGSVWILEADGTILMRLPLSPGQQNAAAAFYWSPDSQRLACLYDGVIDVWHIAAIPAPAR